MEIIASYMPRADGSAAAELRHPPVGATMVELRADALPAEAPLAELVAASPLPVVLTLRSRAEGGAGPDGEAERRRFFTAAATLDVALFDLEAARDAALLGEVIPPERVILSAHFDGVPSDLEERARRCLAAGSRYVKLVSTAANLDDVLAVLSLARAFEHGESAVRRGIVFASGEAGRATRLLGPLTGAPVAYGAWEAGREAAAGQYTPAALARLIGHLSGRPRRVFAVVGRPIAGSLSPPLHAAAYRALGLPNLFVPLEIGEGSELDRLVAPLGASCLDDLGLPLGGLAVTMPWKGEAASRCDVVAPRAERAGAVNTVIPRPGKVLGDCTDIDGLNGVLREAGIELHGARVLVLGTGGAARAAVVGLGLAGAEVAVAGRDRERAASLAARTRATAVSIEEADRVGVVVNATPAGAGGEREPWLEKLRGEAGTVVVDLPYGDAPTALELLAGERGWHYVGGREVLLFQGISQFAAMNQVAPPVRAMAEALGLEEVQG